VRREEEVGVLVSVRGGAADVVESPGLGVAVPVPGVGVATCEVDREELAVEGTPASERPIARRKRSLNAMLFSATPRVSSDCVKEDPNTIFLT